MKKTLLAFTIFCLSAAAQAADPQDDMRRAHELGLPFSSVWMIFDTEAGFHTEWQCQTAASHWFLATIKVPMARPMDNQPMSARWLNALKQHGAANLPLCIRDDNRATAIQQQKNRLPLTEENIPLSPVVINLTPDGQLEDEALSDVFGPTTVWENEARLRATTPYIQSIQAVAPSPAWIEDADNNEAGLWQDWCSEKGCILIDKNHANWPAPNVPAVDWKTPEAVRQNNLRLDQWINANGGYGSDPYRFTVAYDALRVAKYRAYDAAFDNASPTGWKNRLTAAYSNGPEAGFGVPQFVTDAVGPGGTESNCYDAISTTAYVAKGNVKDDMTGANRISLPGDAFHLAAEYQSSKNPQAYREYFVSLAPAGALYGAKAGIHQVLSPAHWTAYCQFCLWQARARTGGVPVNLRYWTGYSVPRAGLFFGDPNEIGPANESPAKKSERLDRIAKALQNQADLDRFGVPQLKTTTTLDYVMATVAAADTICSDSTLREFWVRGQTVPVSLRAPCAAPYCVIKLGNRYLIFAWTPISGQPPAVVIDGDGKAWNVDFQGKPYGYWLIEPPQVPAKTIRKLG